MIEWMKIMSHIFLRRFSLVFASICFSLLTATVLLYVSASAMGGTEAIVSDACEMPNNQDIVALPCPISCTPIMVRELAVYDGKLWEDGTGREVEGAAAVMLYNSAEYLVPYAYITVYTKNQCYQFEASCIPAKSAILVPECKGTELSETDITRIFGWVTVKDTSQNSQLAFEELNGNEVVIQNLSGKRISSLKIYYHSYISDGDFYMGGKAFSYLLNELPPGETVCVKLDNYAPGYSRIVHYE